MLANSDLASLSFIHSELRVYSGPLDVLQPPTSTLEDRSL